MSQAQGDEKLDRKRRRYGKEEAREGPDLGFGLELYLNAFRRLHSCRILGMGPGPIPWLAIDDYADRLRLDDDQREALHYHVRALDQVYLAHHAKVMADEAKRNKGR